MPVFYSPDGLASYWQMITSETKCDLDTSGFPFDQHTCIIQFQVSKLGVHFKSVSNDFILHLLKPDGSWDVVNASMNYQERDINIELILARKPTFILVNLIFPMTMLALLSPLVFLLPNNSGERVGFSITVLLSISVFMTIVSDHVPQKSHPFPLVLTLLFISYSQTVAVVMAVVINARVYRLPETVPIPRPLIWLYMFTRRFCCCFRRRNKLRKIVDDVEGDIEEKTNLDDIESQSCNVNKANSVTWKDISWAIDMFFMSFTYLLKSILVVAFMITL